MLRGQAHQAEEQARFQQREREKQADLLAQKKAALQQAAERRQGLHAQIVRDEEKYREVAERLRKTSVQLEKLKETERQENDLMSLREELKGLPADPAAQPPVEVPKPE